MGGGMGDLYMGRMDMAMGEVEWQGEGDGEGDGEGGGEGDGEGNGKGDCGR